MSIYDCERCGQRRHHNPCENCGSSITRERAKVELAIIELWCALRALSDYGADAMTDYEADLFATVTKSRAVRARLK